MYTVMLSQAIPESWYVLAQSLGLSQRLATKWYKAFAQLEAAQTFVFQLEHVTRAPDNFTLRCRLWHFLHSQHTPQQTMALLELCVERGLLGRQEANAIAEAVLAQVGADGQWR